MRSVGNVLLGYKCTKDAPLLSYGGRLHGGPQRHSHILLTGTYESYLTPKMVFAEVIKLRIRRWGDYIGLSRWTLNAISGVCPYKREAQRDFTQKRRRHTQQEETM